MKIVSRDSITCCTLLVILFSTGNLTAHVNQSNNQSCEAQNKNLVMLSVTVTSQDGRFARNLTADSFRVFANKALQSITYFCAAERPASVGILLDVSGSMQALNAGRTTDNSRECILRFVQQLSPSTDFFVIAFGEKMEMIEWTDKVEALKRGLETIKQNKGATPLYEAIFNGLQQLRSRTGRKRVLIILSDGLNNNSKQRVDDIIKELKKSDVITYTFCYTDPVQSGDAVFFGERALKEFAFVSGGSSFFARRPKELLSAFDTVAAELRSQYSIGFIPSPNTDGQWCPITVNVKPQILIDPDQPNRVPKEVKLTARTRIGYQPSNYSH